MDNNKSIARISGWAALSEQQLLSEPGFSLADYIAILDRELAELDQLIDVLGVRKSGGRFVGRQSGIPSIDIADLDASFFSIDPAPAWQRRYSKDENPGVPAGMPVAPRLVRWLVASGVARRLKPLYKRLAVAGTALLARRGTPSPNPDGGSELEGLLTRLEIAGSATDQLVMFCVGDESQCSMLRAYVERVGGRLVQENRPEVDLASDTAMELVRFTSDSVETWRRTAIADLNSGSVLVFTAAALAAFLPLFEESLPVGSTVVVLGVSQTTMDSRLWEPVAGPESIGVQMFRRQSAATPDDHPELPLISIVTISYNQVDFVRRTLDSVLNQGYPRLQYVVVDGGSTDGTSEILEEYRDRIDVLVIESDEGQSDALNKGFALCTGEVMNWLCSDDELEDGALHAIGRAFADSNVDLVAGSCRVINTNDEVLVNHANGIACGTEQRFSLGDLLSFSSVWQKGMFFFQPEVFFSRSIWERSGAGIKKHLHFAMDYELFLRFAMAGARIKVIPEVIGRSRTHEDQKTRHQDMLYLPSVRSILAEYRELLTSIRDSAS